MHILFLHAAMIIWILVTLLWILSVIIKDASIVDIFWGLGFVIINAICFLPSEDPAVRQYITTALVTIWGIRLAGYLAWRNIGKGEDKRYQEFRRQFGPGRYWWFSYFQVFLLQGILMLVVSLPLVAIHTSTRELNVLDYAAVVVWLVGFVFEAGGDYQLARFKSDPENRGKVLKTGLWRYTRHPNYFGDAAVWFGYALFCLASGSYWQVAGTVLMIVLIIRVSGVALLERSLKDAKPGYREYIEKTNSFFPWPPKQ